jgi:hypothetical protein
MKNLIFKITDYFEIEGARRLFALRPGRPRWGIDFTSPPCPLPSRGGGIGGWGV